jgi:hypothetical protein
VLFLPDRNRGLAAVDLDRRASSAHPRLDGVVIAIRDGLSVADVKD